MPLFPINISEVGDTMIVSGDDTGEEFGSDVDVCDIDPLILVTSAQPNRALTPVARVLRFVRSSSSRLILQGPNLPCL